jgi:hypothetical protein
MINQFSINRRCSVKGYREIPQLIVALQQKSIDRKEAAA